NNTIYGTQFKDIPSTAKVPIIADLTSDILSKKYEVNKFGMIYAGTQKNIGLPGLAVCIIRADLLQHVPNNIPSIFNYNNLVAHDSMYNTPNTFGIYMCRLVLEWIN